LAVVNKQPPLLKVGSPTKIGTITANGDQLRFAIPVECSRWRGQLMLQAVANGTVTTFTANINASIDGSNYQPLPAQTALNFQTTPLQRIESSGCGGLPVEFQVASLTLGTATAIDIFGHVG
jgi:hypothetical protein